jgi:hypothetical protein
LLFLGFKVDLKSAKMKGNSFPRKNDLEISFKLEILIVLLVVAKAER